MLDIKLIRKDPQGVEEKIKTKDPDASLASIIELDEKLRATKTEVETLKAKRNEFSKKIHATHNYYRNIRIFTIFT